MGQYEEERLRAANRQLMEALGVAKEKMLEMQAQLEELMTAPSRIGTVIEVRGRNTIVATSEGLVCFKDKQRLRTGDTVLFLGDGNIVETISPVGVGATAVVKSVEQSTCTIDWEDGVRVIICTLKDVEVGDRLVLDPLNFLAVKNLGKAAAQFVFNEDTNVSWDDIGGQEQAKQKLIEAIEHPVKYAAFHKAYKKPRVKGVLLYGPHGCGKTMLGKAVATSLRKTHGGKGAETSFIYVKGPEVLNMFVGNSESTIRGLFESARSHFKKHGYPAVIFIDEADALLGSRDQQGTLATMERTIVPQFLSEMDGLEESGAMVLLSTNLPNRLDPAVVRDGRVDRKVKVSRPNREETKDIFLKHLRGKPLKTGVSAEEIAETGAAEVHHPARRFYEVSFKDGRKTSITLGTLVNGAMIASILTQAISHAMERDIKTNTVSGITQEDIARAVDDVEAQNRDLDHEREAQDLLQEAMEFVENVRKVKGDRHVSSTNGKAAKVGNGAPQEVQLV